MSNHAAQSSRLTVDMLPDVLGVESVQYPSAAQQRSYSSAGRLFLVRALRDKFGGQFGRVHVSGSRTSVILHACSSMTDQRTCAW